MTTWPAAVIFDFDGVIVDSEPLHCRGFQAVLAEEGITLSDAEYYDQLIGFDDRGAFAHLFKRHERPLDPETFGRVLHRKAKAIQDMIDAGDFSALPGVDALVRGLAVHYPLAICSGALRPEIERMLDGLKLRSFFPTITAAEDVPVGKPDPRGYLLTVDRLRERTGLPLTPADCLVVEDAPSVIRTTAAAGFVTLGVATSHPMSDLAHARYAIDRLEPAEVVKLIPELRVG